MLLCASLTLIVALFHHVPPISCGEMPTYSLNLDLPPEERWAGLGIEKYLPTVEKFFDAVAKDFIPSWWEKYAVQVIADEVEDRLPVEYAREIKGIAKAVNFDLWKLVMLNLVPDVSSFCTSIVAVDGQGQIWHGRNLDFQYTEYLKNLSVMIDYKKNNKTLFRTSTFVGSVGVFTGIKPNAFTVTMDSMVTGDPLSLFHNILVEILKGNKATSNGFLIRDTLVGVNDFDSAVNKLAYTTTFSKAYYIVGGLKASQGAVITKENYKPKDIWYLNQTEAGWYMVETNSYHKDPPGVRRAMAQKLMNKMGQVNFSTKALFNVLSTYPVRNGETITTTLMSASHPQSFYSVVRDDPMG